MGKEEPSNDSPDCDASEQTCEDDQKYSSSVLAHDASPFVSLNRKPKLLNAAGSRPTLAVPLAECTSGTGASHLRV
jgi:hypothetical protein